MAKAIAPPAAWRLRLASRRSASASSSMRVVITTPSVNLEVDKAGKPTWRCRPGASRTAAPEEKPQNRRRHARGVELGDINIDQGQLSYGNAATGQTHGRQERHARCHHGEFGKPARAISARRLRISTSICRSKAAPKRSNPASQRRPAPISDSRPRSLASSCRTNCSGNSVRSLFFPQSRVLALPGSPAVLDGQRERSAARGTGGCSPVQPDAPPRRRRRWPSAAIGAR
jgi:hypothetical protein